MRRRYRYRRSFRRGRPGRRVRRRPGRRFYARRIGRRM